jgi:hypothetical protein
VLKNEASFNDKNPAMIHQIYEPETGYNDGDILNVEMSMDIFGPSTTETMRLEKHPTLGFNFCSPNGTERPIYRTVSLAPKQHSYVTGESDLNMEHFVPSTDNISTSSTMHAT